MFIMRFVLKRIQCQIVSMLDSESDVSDSGMCFNSFFFSLVTLPLITLSFSTEWMSLSIFMTAGMSLE